MTTEMVQAAETAAMPANGTGAKADAKAAAAAEVTANGSPSQANGKGSAPPSTEKPPGENGAEAPADSEAAAKAKEEEAALRKKEDEVLAKGAEIAGVRALLARAYSKPAEEPLRAPTTWTYVLEEAAWMAADFSQERLWRHTAALAVAFEIAKKGGDFDLKQPPKEFRKYSDEIRELRLAAVKTDAPPPSSSRRASARATPQPPQASTFLALDPESDPGIKWLEEGAAIVPGTPPLDDLSKALAFPCDEEFVEALGKHLMTSEVDRLIKEEIAYRSYRLEYEASLVSHQLAVAEQTAAANTIDLGLGASFGIEGMEDGTSYGQAAGAKKSNKRRKTGGAARSGGFLGLDDFGVEEEDGGYGNKRSATSKAALVEDVYLRKRRPQRPAAYRDVDADYDVGVETGTRYGTRRATGALARNQARMAAADRNRRVGSGRADAYQQQQAARARAQGQGMPGTVVWQKAEEDLLLAVVHEFGVNWTLVSEVLSLSLRMQGVHRPAAQCRQRFRILTIQDGQDYSEERAYATLSAQMAKQTAREMLVHSLPVRDDALVQRLEALVQVGSNAKHRKNIEERRNEALRTKRQDMHASYMTVLTTIQHQTGGRELNPLELSAHVNNTYLAQRQQQMMAQQAQQAAHMPPPQPGQPMQPQQQQQQPAQQQQQQPGQPGAPAPAAGQPAPAHGTPAGPPAVGMPGGVPGAPMGPPSGGALPGLPPAAGMQMPGSKPGQTPQISLHQLNTILASNKLPNGQELTDEMRQAIEKKRQLFLQHVQQQQRQQGTPGAAPGVPPGQPGMQPPMQGGPKVPGQAPGPSAASLAAMQASQQAAAIQAVTRPPLPPGVFGVPPGAGIALPPGAPGQPVSLPPGMQGIPGMGQQMTSMAQPGMPLPAGVSAAQLTGASAAMAMPGVQPGLVLPPGQHLLAQQMMQQQAVQQAQQQQAAAAAAAAAAQTKPAQ